MTANRRPHILMIDSEETWRGGEGQLALLMKGLVAEGFPVTLAAGPDAAITTRAEAIGVPCLPLSISGGMDLSAAWRLRKYLREGDFDIMHCHASHAHSVAFLATRKATRRPALVISRRVDFPVARNGFSALKYRYGADVYVAISNGVRDVLGQCGISSDRIALVPSGIDLDKFAGSENYGYLLEEYGLSESTPVIGNIAALAPHKSQTDFIKAASLVRKEVPRAKFFIVGEGDSRPELESLIRQLDMEQDLLLTGFRRDVLVFLSMFDCFVLSSYLEGLCTSIMDAQVSGVPVVATRTGGVPDLVEDGKTGLLVPPRRPEMLAEAIVRMLREPGLKEACAKAAKAKASSYDYRNMVRGTIEVYDQVLESGVAVN